MPRLKHGFKSAIDRGARSIRRRLLPFSDYDQTIPPEIVDDEFYEVIRSIASEAPVESMLEIGSSTGEGSTRAFVEGIHANARRPQLYCIELSRPRFKLLAERYRGDPQVHCYNVTSVPGDRLPTETELVDFYEKRESKLNRVPLNEVLRWLRQDTRYVSRLANQNGIRQIKEQNQIDRFGVVLIDGSEFTGSAELDEVYGADYILLDDIGTFKNGHNNERLIADPAYRLTASNPDLRNGYAVFERLGQAAVEEGPTPAARL